MQLATPQHYAQIIAKTDKHTQTNNNITQQLLVINQSTTSKSGSTAADQ